MKRHAQFTESKSESGIFTVETKWAFLASAHACALSSGLDCTKSLPQAKFIKGAPRTALPKTLDDLVAHVDIVKNPNSVFMVSFKVPLYFFLY